MDRVGLVRRGLKAAEAARDAADVDPFGPADPYAVAEKLGLRVNFSATSMEGFYFKGKPANILVSSLRPVGRRAFTCAHELGHHWFGHGSTIDQLQEDERADSSKPDEVLAWISTSAEWPKKHVGMRSIRRSAAACRSTKGQGRLC